MARIGLRSPETIIDLGCGAGELTRILAARWPNAGVTGLDSSPDMLDEARSADAEVGRPGGPLAWIQSSIEDWLAPAHDARPLDLVYSNATLHWLADHPTLFRRLIERLTPGGCLAVQMPLSWHAPSHRLMREVLASGGPDAGSFGPPDLRESLSTPPVMSPLAYHTLLQDSTASLDIWSTEYLHTLEPVAHSPGRDADPPHPVLEWIRGSGLRPILEALEDAERESFLDAYQSHLADTYPLDAEGGAVYPFPRLFIVATR
jgi:trans-aconitate 2-methyltransferase